MAITKALAEFASNLNFKDISNQAVNTAKVSICDFIACAIAGRDVDASVKVKEYILEQGGAQDCSIPAQGFRTNAQFSALLCGTMGHALDFDDGNSVMRIHPGVAITPVIWALGDKYNISGECAIEAYLAGFEVGAYISLFTMSPSIIGPWHPTKQLGVMCAAVSAAKIMDLTVPQIRAALGIAASMSGGLKQNYGTMTKPLHPGLSARDGIIAATLAKKGFSADINIIEAEFGFGNTFRAGETMSEEAVLDLLNKNISDGIFFADKGNGIKQSPACGSTHKAMNVIIDLANREDIKPEDVESIIVEGEDYILSDLFAHEPKTPLEAKFSMEFVAAVAISKRKVGLSEFTEEMIKEMEPLMKKVSSRVVSLTKVFADHSQTVHIKLVDGRTLTNSSTNLSSIAKRPLPWDELLQKYSDCTSSYLSKQDAIKSGELLRNIENMTEFRTLVEIVAK